MKNLIWKYVNKEYISTSTYIPCVLGGWYNPPPGVNAPVEPRPGRKEYSLYDLNADPTERNDISSRADVSSVYASMVRKLDGYRRQVTPSRRPRTLRAGRPQRWGGAWTPGWC